MAHASALRTAKLPDLNEERNHQGVAM